MTTNKPLWHGIMLVAGGAIGAGMFALPMASAGPWMFWATIGFVFVWFMTWLSASLLAKVNIALVAQPDNNIELTSSFDSLVSQVLGAKWAMINNACIMFIMMILMYAYTTAGANIIGYSLDNLDFNFTFNLTKEFRHWLSVCFATVVALIVWLGTSIVSRVTLFLMVAMVITFCIATFGLLPNVQFSALTQTADTLPHLTGAMPVYITAFACAGLIPTLVRHYPSHIDYPNNQKNVFRSVFWGTFIALMVYLFWLVVTLGSIGREGFITVLADGGNIGDLVKALVANGADAEIQSRLTLFSHCAIITSFLSVSLGLMHFMLDKLSLSQSKRHKLIATACSFAPPVLGSFFAPYGFVHAISFAGMFVAFSFLILPGMLALKVGKVDQVGKLEKEQSLSLISWACIVFGASILLIKIASMFSLLPAFG